MTDLNNKARLRWACRRGMLELDVLLMPFVEQAYDQLDETEQALFRQLLECDDPQLFAWFMGHQTCTDPGLARIVDVILKRVKV